MNTFWGSFRSLQYIFAMSLIRFTLTPLMAIFLLGMSEFAKADIYNGEDFYENHFGLRNASVSNPQFNLFGIET